ncbi:MAG: hypothetical protein K0S68_630 [Candidatus Saccharibacteria bacterium]|jgi:hypothetical protein|nr:hypothetical protein [Candidatus Saccharibacteria bacterium]
MKRAILLAVVLVLLALLAPGPTSHSGVAQATCAPNNEGKCEDGPVVSVKPCVSIALPISGTSKCVNNSSANGGAIVNYLKTILKLLGGAIGLFIILMLIIAGIGYITSFGDPTQIKNSKGRVVNALTALLLYLMMFALLQFLVPGGIL